MTNNFIRLNTAIIPDKHFYELAIELSKRIAQQFETHFTLDGINNLPHVTLYPPEYPEHNKQLVIEDIEKIADETKQFALNVSGIGGGEGWISIDFNASPEVIELHERLVNNLNAFREGHLRAKYHKHEYIVNLDEATKEVINKYGYPGVLNNFKPHLTITRLKNSSDFVTAKQIVESALNQSEMTVAKIGIHTTGLHGTVKKVLRQFELG